MEQHGINLFMLLGNRWRNEVKKWLNRILEFKVETQPKASVRPVFPSYYQAGLAQWWERSPSTIVTGVRFRPRRHTWVEFVKSTLCSERFYPGYPGFPLSPETKTLIWFVVIEFDLWSQLVKQYARLNSLRLSDYYYMKVIIIRNYQQFL